MPAILLRRCLFLLLCLCTAHLLKAQQFPPGGMPGGNPAAHISGKIVDAQGKPISGASVLVLQAKRDSATRTTKNVLLKGQTTRQNGVFDFEDLPVRGKLTLKVSMSGMQDTSLPISFMLPAADTAHGAPKQGMVAASQGMPAGGKMPSFEKDLGNITLQSSANQLQAVTVSASRSMLKLDMDKKVFNVEKNIVSTGGTALDVMRNVPSVNVDIDGNVTMRNSTPQIYIDGRPTTLTLDQIPADAIENVEIMTNPSAKYDASGGGAGILNIVLKKNRKTGYNGNLRAGVDKRGGINAGGDINVREGKFNVSASVMTNQMRDRTRGNTVRENLTGDPLTNVLQNNYDKNKGGFQFAKLGLDYFAGSKTTLSVSGIKVHGVFSPSSVLNTQTDSLYSGSAVSAYSVRNSQTHRVFNGNGLTLGLKQLFKKEGAQLTADFNYFGGHDTNNALYTTNNMSKPGGDILGTQQQQTIGSGKNRFITIQTDYVHPFNDKTKLEAGLRASLQHLENNNDNYLLNSATGKFNKLDYASTNYANNNNVYAAYVSLTSSIKNFGYQLGLRAERSDYSGDLLNTGEHFSNNYPISLFPSVFLTQKLNNNQQLQLSVTRRINRPNFFQLIPYTDYSDSLNITRGNPALVPEFTQSYEFSYMKTFKGNNTLLASAYYKRSNHLITRYLDTATNPVSEKQDIINTYINANSSYTAGLEITSQNYLTKWWDISTNLNFYQSKIDAAQATSAAQDAILSWFGKFNSNFKLPAKITLQLTATYQSKTNLPVNDNKGGMGGGPPGMQTQSASQGYIKPFYGIDFAVRKTFLKNDAASVSLSISDIFRTRKNEQYAESAYFIQDYSRLRDPQMVRLNFSWRFGKIDAQLFKRKNMNQNMDGMQGMQ
ncbi:TonB-dependent receptor [Deminuibacter soli]|uniref:TonB-dependent receptor n=1 Tax=Deminuibacter soli TaxID=2291815 RepID=A0A3E1NK36_9BACT|nr:TonB-dependent receptor [Deminuibacter soli]RFM28241.1 TonB-dependent receptor [Deminuibacter soli]